MSTSPAARQSTPPPERNKKVLSDNRTLFGSRDGSRISVTAVPSQEIGHNTLNTIQLDTHTEPDCPISRVACFSAHFPMPLAICSDRNIILDRIIPQYMVATHEIA